MGVGARELFGTTRDRGDQAHETLQVKLYEEVGQLNLKLDWIKNCCVLLNLGRANWYYDSVEENTDTLELIRQIDQQYTRPAFYGDWRMIVNLNGLGSWAE